MCVDDASGIDEKCDFPAMQEFLEKQLGRELSILEERKIQWLSEWEYETVYVLFNLIKEIADK